jgi:hypothetical protein
MDTECPYCGADIEINHDDGYGYEENRAYQQHCHECDNNFVYFTTISFSYDTQKADCLNGADHRYKPTHTHPNYFTKMRCEDCEKERNLTQKEKEELGIPKEYTL